MKTLQTTSYILVIALFCSSCVLINTQKDLHGDQNLVEKKETFDAFDQITVEGELNISVKQGTEHSVRLVIDENLLEYVDVTYKDNHIKISTDDDYLLKPTNKKQVIITTENLKGVKISGMCDAEFLKIKSDALKINASGATHITGTIDAHQLTVNTSGTGDVKLLGSAEQLTLKSSGASRFKGGSFEAEEAYIDISGASDVVIAVNSTLDIKASGASKISYIGSPEVTKDVSGAASVKQLEQ